MAGGFPIRFLNSPPLVPVAVVFAVVAGTGVCEPTHQNSLSEGKAEYFDGTGAAVGPLTDQQDHPEER